MGLSLGSVLLLAALGLAITYGLLGVINMAHGEMLMIGAYSCWLVQQALAQLAPQWLAFIRWSRAGRLPDNRRHRHGAGTHYHSSSLWPAAGDAAGHLGLA